MKKRLLLISMAAMLAFGSLTACGKSNDDNDKGSNKKERKASDTDKLLVEASDLMNNGEYEEASEILEGIIEDDDECVDAYSRLATCYIEMGQALKAKKILEEGMGNTGSDKLSSLYEDLFGENAVDDDDDYVEDDDDDYIDDDDDVIVEDDDDSVVGTLEDYINSPMVKTSLDNTMQQLLEENSQVFSDIGYYVDGNEITYYYTFAYDASAQDFSGQKASLDANADSLIGGMRQESGVQEEISVNYIYYNNDGSVLEIFNYRG